MKNLFVVAVATSIFTGTSFRAGAQTSVNPEQLTNQSNKSAEPKFISTIELTPGSAVDDGTFYSEESTGRLPAPSVERKTTAAPAKPASTKAGASIEKCSALQFKYAMMMDVEVETVSNIPLYTFIEDWWATRYRYGGTDRSGIDCSSFTGKLIQEIYSTTLPRTARDQYAVCEKIQMDDLQEGDLVFFNTRGGVSHTGVYLGNNYFVHSSTHSGVTISSLTDDYYNKRFISGGRIAAATVKK